MTARRPGCGFTQIPHTADLAVVCWAPTLKELAATAAEAMFSLMGTPQSLALAPPLTVVCQGVDREDALVRVLTDLLQRFDATSFFVTHAECLDFAPLFAAGDTDWHVKLQVNGGLVNRHVERGLIEIKAVTYHALFVGERHHRWEAEIIFDL